MFKFWKPIKIIGDLIFKSCKLGHKNKQLEDYIVYLLKYQGQELP